MICNERQYSITKAKIKKFELAIADLNSKELPSDLNQQLRYQAHLDALNSQLEELYEEVQEYENLKQGNIKSLKIDSLEQLPEALIKARIVRGLTQEKLAEILKVHPQQVQRDEANRYVSPSFTRILEVKKALNISIKEEVIFN
jgi:ribosome-binding protein aMBF1 (putative translation factor)